MEVCVDNGSFEVFGELYDFLDPLAHDDSASGEDDRKFCLGDEFRCFVECFRISACAFQVHGFGECRVDFSVEHVSRDIELCGSSFESRVIETSREEFCDALLVSYVGLEFCNFFEKGKLFGFLESSESLRVGSRFGSEDDDGRVRPVCSGDACDEVGDSWPVLRDAEPDFVRGAGEPIGHMCGALFVSNGDESDSCGIEEVEGVHESGSDDSESVGDALFYERFYDSFGGGHNGHGFSLPL